MQDIHAGETDFCTAQAQPTAGFTGKCDPFNF
jgi:hypothetical protein